MISLIFCTNKLNAKIRGKPRCVSRTVRCQAGDDQTCTETGE
jgi:hypothetical protein